jgi:hypothetical protein
VGHVDPNRSALYYYDRKQNYKGYTLQMRFITRVIYLYGIPQRMNSSLQTEARTS